MLFSHTWSVMSTSSLFSAISGLLCLVTQVIQERCSSTTASRNAPRASRRMLPCLERPLAAPMSSAKPLYCRLMVSIRVQKTPAAWPRQASSISVPTRRCHSATTFSWVEKNWATRSKAAAAVSKDFSETAPASSTFLLFQPKPTVPFSL